MTDSAQMAANAALTLDETDWFLDVEKVAEVISWMHERGDLITARDVIAVIEKPWKFTDAYREMRAC